MTMRLTFGIDPGLSGAIATLVDGEPGDFIDMPTREVNGWNEVDASVVAAFMRQQRTKHAGAWITACMEKVGARPGDGGTSAFRFGEGSGAIRGALEALGIPHKRAIPAVWKRHYGLIGQEKDEGRLLAIRRFPTMAEPLKRKKDNGRADALLIALWHESTAMQGARAA